MRALNLLSLLFKIPTLGIPTGRMGKYGSNLYVPKKVIVLIVEGLKSLNLIYISLEGNYKCQRRCANEDTFY